MKILENEFAIIGFYVDDINIVGISNELTKTIDYLKKEFEMKNFGRTKFSLELHIMYLNKDIFVHQEAYITKVLKRFYMDKSHLLCTPMVLRLLDVHKDPFRPLEKDKKLIGPEVPYLSAIGALMYLVNYNRLDITFIVNLLARYSFSLTRRYWSEIKHILCYLKGTMNMDLFCRNDSKLYLMG